MGNIVLYIAQSLDGYIARPDGNLDWLTSTPNPASGGDYGYAELLASIDTIIMGRRTYDEILGFGIEWPYLGFKTFVVTTDKNLAIKSPDTYLLTENLKDFVTALKNNSAKDAWLVGGGQLVTYFINNGMLDRMIISIIPKLIGEGIPLFAKKPAETEWKLINVQQFDTGLVNLTYDKTR